MGIYYAKYYGGGWAGLVCNGHCWGQKNENEDFAEKNLKKGKNCTKT